MTARYLRLATCAAALSMVTACGGGPEVTTGAGAEQAPAPVPTASSAEPDPTPSPEPSVTAEETFSGGDEDAGTAPSGTAAPETVSTALSDTPLGLDRVFATVGEWEENRYEVADRSDVAGMGVSVQTCRDDDSAPELEYRLANRFRTLRFDVSQSNASPSSDQLLAVVVLGNEEQRDIQKVPFNQVKPIQIDVTGVNALKIRFYLEDEGGCSYESAVTAVVEDLRVS